MTRRLETLTAEQQSLLPKLRNEWINHGLSCATANRDLAVEGVNAAYRAAGLEPPRIVVSGRTSPTDQAAGGRLAAPLRTPKTKEQH